MSKKTIKLNNEAKLVLEGSYNEVNDAIIKAMIKPEKIGTSEARSLPKKEETPAQ